jgi:hypothetical protein
MLDVQCSMLPVWLNPSAMNRIPQPPINPALREVERHGFWPGSVAVMVGLVLAFCGVRHLTALGTVTGNSASEIQLVKAFSSGGVQYASEWKPPPPPRLADPAAQAEALDRWARQQANAAPPTWKIRVDPAAASPCPT